MFDLLQVGDTLAQTVKYMAGDANQDGKLSLFELLSMGGWIMIPLGLMLLVAGRTEHRHSQCRSYR